MTLLDHEQLTLWEENGYILLPGSLSAAEAQQLERWTSALSDLPETPGKWMKYFERSLVDRTRMLLCRIENFVPYHEEFSRFLRNEAKIAILSQLMGERAVLFKEKVNFKLPGGNGFKPHQDAPAYTTFEQTYHVTMMISIDPSTRENGCLEVVKGHHKHGILAQEPDGTLRRDVVDSLLWEPILMSPGDVLFFDSYLPHGSGSNKSDAPRRALYVTYNRISEGDRRDDYFAHKRLIFPPECERIPGVDYSKSAGVYNLGNPID
jgi:2-aminoethylphosphonate dioxygenase